MSYIDAAKSKNSRKIIYVRMSYLQPLDPADFTWDGKVGQVTTASVWTLPTDIPYANMVLSTYSAETKEATGDLGYWNGTGTQPTNTWGIVGGDLLIKSDIFNAEDGVYNNPIIYVRRVLRLADSYYYALESGINYPVEQRIKSLGNFSRKADLIKNESFTVGKVNLTCINKDGFFNDILDNNIFKSQKVEIYSLIFDNNLTLWSNKIGDFKIDQVDYGDSDEATFNLLEASFMSVLTAKDTKTIDSDSTTASPYGFVKNYKSEFPKLSGVKTLSFSGQDLIYVGTGSIVSAFPNPLKIQPDNLADLKHFPKGSKFLCVDPYDNSVFHNEFVEVIAFTGNSFQITDPVLSTDPTGGQFDLYVTADNYLRDTIDNTITTNYAGDDDQFISSDVVFDAVATAKSIYVGKNMSFLQAGDELALVYEDGTSHTIWVKDTEISGPNLKVNLYNQLAWDLDATTTPGTAYILFNKISSYTVEKNPIRTTKTRFEITLPSDTIINAANWWQSSGADYLYFESPYINMYLQMVNSGDPLVNPGDFSYATGLSGVMASILALNNDTFISNQAAILYDERYPRKFFVEANYSPDDGFDNVEDVSNSRFTNGIYLLGYIHLDWFAGIINYSGIGIVDFDFSDNEIKTTLNCNRYIYPKSKIISYVNGTHTFDTYTSNPDDRIKRKITAVAQPGYYMEEYTVIEEVGALNFTDPDVQKKAYRKVNVLFNVDLFKDVNVGDVIMANNSSSELYRVVEKDDDNNIYVHNVPTNLVGANKLRYVEWEDLGGTSLAINGCLTSPNLADMVQDIAEFSYGIDVANKIDYAQWANISDSLLPVNRLGLVLTKDDPLYKSINKMLAATTIISYLKTDGKLTARLLDIDNLTSVKTLNFYDLIKVGLKTVNNINNFFTIQVAPDSGGSSDTTATNYDSETVNGLDAIINIDNNMNISTAQYSQYTADELAETIKPKLFQNYKEINVTGTMDLAALELGQVFNIVNYNRVSSDSKWIIVEINTNGSQTILRAISFYSPIAI